MKRLLAALLFVAVPAFASPAVVSTAEMPLATVKLYDAQCSRGVVLAQIKPEFRSKWKDGDAVMKDGSTDKFCWRRIDDGVVVVSEAGVEGVVPHEYFSPEVK